MNNKNRKWSIRKVAFVAVFVVLISIVWQHATVEANACTDSCDAQYTTGFPVAMCGTDFMTHRTNSSVFYGDGGNPCYDLCGVMTYYAGQCGCPNDCFEQFGRGNCASASASDSDSFSCICAAGWGGADCSLPVSSNPCSSHGQLIAPSEKNSMFPFEYCLCDAEFTGPDCSSLVLLKDSGGTYPWRAIFADDMVPYSDDKYGDDHPVWNISVLATVRLNVQEKDLLYLLYPENLYNASYISADCYFDNGIVQQSMTNVGLHLKGQGSRMDQKKGWYIKFNEFVKGQKLIDEVSKIGFKGGSSTDDTLIKAKLASELYYAMGAPVQRSSYALLYINNMFMGLYLMVEDIGNDFIDSRFPGDGSGNLMKLFYNVHLQYFGSDDTYYKEKVAVMDTGSALNYYEQDQGNGDWSDFISWLAFFNSSSDSSFQENLATFVNTTNLLRSMVVESFLLSEDNIESGNNMFVYHQTKKEFQSQWILFSYDFDDIFKFDQNCELPMEETDIFAFFNPDADGYENFNPLVTRMLAIPAYSDSYLEYYDAFLSHVFDTNNSPIMPSDRYQNLKNLVWPWMQQDKLWQLSYGVSVEQLEGYTSCTMKMLSWRYQSALVQIKALRKV